MKSSGSNMTTPRSSAWKASSSYHPQSGESNRTDVSMSGGSAREEPGERTRSSRAPHSTQPAQSPFPLLTPQDPHASNMWSFTSFNQGADLSRALPGLGVMTTNTSKAQQDRDEDRIFGPGIIGQPRYTQSQDYHRSNNQGSFTKMDSNTATLPQQPSRPMLGANISPSTFTGRSNHSAAPNTSTLTPTTSGTRDGGGQKHLSHPPTHDSSGSGNRGGPQNTGKCVVWTEHPHQHSLRNALKDAGANWEEAYPGALKLLAAVNPENFAMDFTTRIVNIKCEFTPNLILSIREGKYSAMEKVSERIMKVWDAKPDPSHKILLLFSVNGGKRYSGLAELTGPWDPRASIVGWTKNPEGNSCVGSFPITWIYIKDVAYHTFNRIRQSHNDHPVGNMWNGMNFPPDLGLRVLELYIKTPATSSVLGHPRNYHENAGLLSLRSGENHGTSQRRGTFGLRGGRGGPRGGLQGAGNSSISARSPGRRPDYQAGDTRDTDESTPIPAKVAAQNTPGGAGQHTYPMPTIGQSMQIPGQLASVFVDNHGKLMLVSTPGAGEHPAATSPQHVDMSDGGMSQPPGYGQLPTTMQQPEMGFGSSHGALVRGNHMNAALFNRSFSSPKDFFEASQNSNLPQSVSMNAMGSRQSVGPGPIQGPSIGQRHPSLTSSSSMNNILQPQGYAYGNQAFYDMSASAHQQGAANTNMALTRPEMQNRQGYQPAVPLNSPSSANLLGPIEETPTRRPIPHSTRGPPSMNSSSYDAVMNQNPQANALRARFHALCAEKYNTRYHMHDPSIEDMDRHVLYAKTAHISAEIHRVEMELAMIGVTRVEMLTTAHYGSNDNVSASFPPGHQSSPVRAIDGQPLYATSTLGSPVAYGQGSFQDTDSLVRRQADPRPNPQHTSPRWEFRGNSFDDPAPAAPTPNKPAHSQLPRQASSFFQNSAMGVGSRPNTAFLAQRPPPTTQPGSHTGGGVSLDPKKQ